MSHSFRALKYLDNENGRGARRAVGILTCVAVWGLWVPVVFAKSTPDTTSATSKRSAPSKASPAPAAQPKSAAAPNAAKQQAKSSPRLAKIEALGPLSVGHPHAGYLVNAVAMPRAPEWVLTVPSHGYGTQETVDSLSHCIRKVHEQFPDSAPVMLGSISAEHGGLLPPHKSHRTGRDADVYFFRKPGARWVQAATEDDIDLPRTWAMLKCFITETDVDMILIDKKPQSWLEQYALSVGESAEWINTLFHDRGTWKTAVVRHVPGHVAHMHVRFVSAQARRRAVRAYDELVEAKLVQPAVQAIEHRVVRGDTLSELAEQYKTSVSQIQSMNELHSTMIKIGQKLTIQKPVDIRGAREAVVVPPRRLPPKSAQPATEHAALEQPADPAGIAGATPDQLPAVQQVTARPTPEQQDSAKPAAERSAASNAKHSDRSSSSPKRDTSKRSRTPRDSANRSPSATTQRPARRVESVVYADAS